MLSHSPAAHFASRKMPDGTWCYCNSVASITALCSSPQTRATVLLRPPCLAHFDAAAQYRKRWRHAIGRIAVGLQTSYKVESSCISLSEESTKIFPHRSRLCSSPARARKIRPFDFLVLPIRSVPPQLGNYSVPTTMNYPATHPTLGCEFRTIKRNKHRFLSPTIRNRPSDKASRLHETCQRKHPQALRGRGSD